MNGVIYKLTSPSGKAYVGQTRDMQGRMRAYRNGGSLHQRALHNAIAKYGWDAFSVSVIACGIQTQDALDRCEVAFVALLESMSPLGYNLRAGGDGGGIPCAETRAKIGATSRGRKHTAETKAKMSAAHMGRPKPKSAATRAKISATLTGRKMSPEARAKMSAAHRGVPKSEAHKAAIAAAKRGKTLSTAHRAAISAGLRKRGAAHGLQ